MIFCKDCRYYRLNPSAEPWGYDKYTCSNPSTRMSVITGEFLSYEISCGDARDIRGACGPEGKLALVSIENQPPTGKKA